MGEERVWHVSREVGRYVKSQPGLKCSREDGEREKG